MHLLEYFSVAIEFEHTIISFANLLLQLTIKCQPITYEWCLKLQ